MREEGYTKGICEVANNSFLNNSTDQGRMQYVSHSFT